MATSEMLLLLLLTPNKILKKTENRVLLSVSEWGPSTVGRTRKKRKIEKTKKTYTLNAIKRLENTDEKNTAVERCTVEVREK